MLPAKLNLSHRYLSRLIATAHNDMSYFSRVYVCTDDTRKANAWNNGQEFVPIRSEMRYLHLKYSFPHPRGFWRFFKYLSRLLYLKYTQQKKVPGHKVFPSSIAKKVKLKTSREAGGCLVHFDTKLEGIG